MWQLAVWEIVAGSIFRAEIISSWRNPDYKKTGMAVTWTARSSYEEFHLA